MEVESKKGVEWEKCGEKERRPGGGNRREKVVLCNEGFQLVSYNSGCQLIMDWTMGNQVLT